ncbi:response regulator [Spirulina major]|uniref:response regulator n=1 Tax=Spirulina major TaxID=270636 RepID=UPI000932844A|nr:response regulator [Spirulina major]
MKSQQRKKPKILVVDDEPDNLDLLYRTFHREYKVFRADNGPAGLEVLTAEPDIAVIISDQRMPIMTGTEFLSLTAVQYPDIIRILLTGYTDVDDLVEAINSGKVFKYVTKPWEAEHLKGIVRQALDTHNVLKVRTEELCRSLRRETLLNTVTNTIRNAQHRRRGSSSSPLREVLQTIVNTVGHLLDVDVCILKTCVDVDEDSDILAYQKEETIAPLSEAQYAAMVWEQEDVTVMQEVQTNPDCLAMVPDGSDRYPVLAAAGVESALIVPLMAQLDLVAVLALHRCDREHPWEDDEIQLGIMVADQAALAISQAQAYEKVQSLAKREALINTITSAIRSTLDPQEIFMTITKRLGTTLDVDGCALSLWTEADEYVQCVGLYDRTSTWAEDGAVLDSEEAQPQLPQSLAPIAGNPVLKQLLHTKEPVVITNMQEQEQASDEYGSDLPLRSPARALLIVPMLVDGQIIGSISLRQSELPRMWSRADIELTKSVASQAAIAVQQSRLYQKTRQQAERLLELDRQKNEFFQNISHEFRTPLTLMIGPLEAATHRDQPLPSDQTQIALRNARRLLRLVNQLLDLQRLDAGRMQPKFRPCDLTEFVEQILESFRPYCDRKGLHLISHLTPCDPVYLDLEKFDKVVYNLLSNAMKFTEANGSITVSVKPAGAYVCLEVRDSGIGIADSQIPFLFDRFRQAEGSVNRSYEGTGLGLALVKEIVELHGGQITVQSIHQDDATAEETTGTAFIIWLHHGSTHLPSDQILEVASEVQVTRAAVELADLEVELQDDDQSSLPDLPLATIPDGVTPEGIDPQKQLILVVDDNSDLRSYVSYVLKSAGYPVCTARNGAEGYSVLEEQRPKLIISDLMMPKVSGLDLIRMVRANEELRGIPIILLTAKADEMSRIEGTEQGADAYLSKPFNDRELLASVRNMLALKSNEERMKELNDYLTEAVLKRFLPPEMVRRAAQGDMKLDLDPEPRLVTILFSDIVGFTQLSSRLESRGIARLLNEYLEAMTQVVFENGGVVDKFMGDAILALFGAPESLTPEEQARRAVATARGMYRVLDDLNQRWRSQGIVNDNDPPPVRFRCGIHQGQSVVGMFGSEHHSDYTAIGPPVNIAARLQESAQPNSILVSSEVAAFLNDQEVEKFQQLQLKGIAEPTWAFWVTKG